MNHAIRSCLCAAGLLGSVLPLQAADDGSARPTADWSMYNYDVTGTRHNLGETALRPANVGQLERKWRFPAEGEDRTVGVIHATPSVVDGFVYFGTATHATFYKLTPDGKVRWSYPIGDDARRAWRASQHAVGLVPADGVYTSALVTENAVYFGDGGGVMYGLDRRTGRALWTLDAKADGFPGAHPANLVMGSPILADGKIVFGGGAYEHARPLDPNYRCCRGRGFVIALEPETGAIAWKYDVGPEPLAFDPPIRIRDAYGEHSFSFGPSTSSVWSSPSWDEAANTVYFGTDIHNAPRKPTADDSRNYTEHSAAVIAVDGRDGRERWVSQLSAGDVWNHTMPAYDPRTRVYKDQSVGDTPKPYTLEVDGSPLRVVGVGCKNGGFYVLRADTGAILDQTPLYLGPPSENPEVDPRMLALPSPIGGLQSGCATDGERVYTNGIDKLPNLDWRRPNPPTGGRVTAIAMDTRLEFWRHERPKVDAIGGTPEAPLFRDVGDPVASGIAVANGLLFFTTTASNRLVALDAATGALLKEVPLGPVFSGPSVSRGRVYVGTGNTLWVPGPIEAYFPKQSTGALLSFGLPGEDEVSRMGSGSE